MRDKTSSTLCEPWITMVRLTPRAMEGNLIGLEFILLTSSTPTQSQEATQEQCNGHQQPTIQWLSQFSKDRDCQTVRQYHEPSDRSPCSSSKWEMSCLPLKWVGPTCQHEWEGIFLSWRHSLSLILSFATFTLSLSNPLKNKQEP
jgi:hypothetical protein